MGKIVCRSCRPETRPGLRVPSPRIRALAASYRRRTNPAADGRPAFSDDFDGPGLDTSVWIPHCLPMWSSRSASAATHVVTGSELRLTIPPDQELWCPEDHEPSATPWSKTRRRVCRRRSSIASSGCRAGQKKNQCHQATQIGTYHGESGCHQPRCDGMPGGDRPGMTVQQQHGWTGATIAPMQDHSVADIAAPFAEAFEHGPIMPVVGSGHADHRDDRRRAPRVG